MKTLILVCLLLVSSQANASLNVSAQNFRLVTATGAEATHLNTALRDALGVSLAAAEVKTTFFECNDGIDFGKTTCFGAFMKPIKDIFVPETSKLFKEMKKLVVTASNGRINPGMGDVVKVKSLVCKDVASQVQCEIRF